MRPRIIPKIRKIETPCKIFIKREMLVSYLQILVNIVKYKIHSTILDNKIASVCIYILLILEPNISIINFG
jgi:hypothetical protein